MCLVCTCTNYSWFVGTQITHPTAKANRLSWRTREGTAVSTSRAPYTTIYTILGLIKLAYKTTAVQQYWISSIANTRVCFPRIVWFETSTCHSESPARCRVGVPLVGASVLSQSVCLQHLSAVLVQCLSSFCKGTSTHLQYINSAILLLLYRSRALSYASTAAVGGSVLTLLKYETRTHGIPR